MTLRRRGRWVVRGKDAASRSYPEDTGETEDAASRRPSWPDGTRLRSVRGFTAGIESAPRWRENGDDDKKGRMEARRVSTPLSLRGRARPAHHRHGSARADRVACDPTGVEGRLDLAPALREASGDRSRLGGPDAVPLPPGLPGAAGESEVRKADPLCRAPAGASSGYGGAPRR